MAVIPRVLGNATRFSISRPEVNVRTAPRTSDYMAVDSAIAVERFIGTGIVFNRNTTNFGTVSLAGIVALNTPSPLVEVVPITLGNPATLEKRLIEFTESGITTQHASFKVQVITSSGTVGAPYFRVFDPYFGATATDFNTNPRNWIWFALKPP